MGNKYAVLDVETTGFNFAKHDRIIEVGVVLIDEQFEVEATWTTLVNPLRDVTSTAVHGITASDVYHAPDFSKIAKELALLLSDRVLIGHNVAFDRNFLLAEFGRLGEEQEEIDEGWFCTQALAKWALPGLPSYSLQNLVEHLLFTNNQAHAALADAEVTALLLKALMSQEPDIESLLQVTDLQQFTVPSDLSSSLPLPRGQLGQMPELSFIQRLVSVLPEQSANPLETEYLACLKRALLDGILSESESEELVTIAINSNLALGDVSRIHKEYFSQLSGFAWSDGILTNIEQGQLAQVCNALGLGDFELELAYKPSKAQESFPAQEVLLPPGSLICLTGTMTPDKTSTGNLLISSGFEITESMSKKVDFLVAADVNSLSGKSAKARQWGIPVLSAEWVWKNF